MNDITTLGGITLSAADTFWLNSMTVACFFIAFIAVWSTASTASEGMAKTAAISAVVLVLAIVGGIVGATSVGSAESKADSANQKSVIEWAGDRYDVDLSKNAANLLIDGEVVAVDGAGVKLTVGQDDGYYLLNVKGLVELPVK
ncbi:hypothetical protein [Leifsonia sp. Leaf264]|uniref:hypothetical protein n=1 Tax=Leifsonia sp. Leaf264 TaxID=1736314 RepID=UPI0006F5D19B|nr:hypothetical protein [Leifsonia sp. Leaf264]KQO98634.1 hypothetical protein ASF30_11265 [Leifsonia sp. Leaf264]